MSLKPLRPNEEKSLLPSAKENMTVDLHRLRAAVQRLACHRDWLTPLIFSGFVTLTVAMACVVMARFGYLPSFETNDDVDIMLSASGIGQLFATAEIPWLKIVLSRALVACYAWERGIPWYGLLHWAMLLASLWVLVYLACALRARLTMGFGLFCLIAALLSFAPSMLNLQWTKTAYLASMASLLGMGACLFAVPSRRAPRKLLFITLCICGVLGISGFCLRKDAWLLSLPTAALLVGVMWWTNGRSVKPRLPELGMVIALLGAILLSDILHERFYAHNGEWARWHALNQAKEPFQNNRIESDRVSEEVLRAADWSTNDYAMLINWAYFDEGVFAPERVTAAAIVLERGAKKDIGKALHKALRGLGGWPTLLCACLLLGAAIAAAENKGAAIGAAMLGGLTVIGLCAYLLTQARLPARVSFPLLFSLPWGVVLSASIGTTRSTTQDDSRHRLIVVLLCGLALGVASVTRDGYWRRTIRVIRARVVDCWALQQTLKQIERVHDRPMTLVIWGDMFPSQALLPFQREPLPAWLSMIRLGTGNQTPVRKREFEALGGDDMLSIAVRDDVYWPLPINTPHAYPSRLCWFYREHWAIEIEFIEAYPDVRFVRGGQLFGLFRLRITEPNF